MVETKKNNNMVNSWTEQPDRLQYMGSQGAGHNLATEQQQ